VPEVRVAAVDDDVARREQVPELLHGLLGDVAGGHHDPDDARWLELLHQLLQRTGAARSRRLGAGHRVIARIERHDLVAASDQAYGHVPAHPTEADHAELHATPLPARRTRTRPSYAG